MERRYQRAPGVSLTRRRIASLKKKKKEREKEKEEEEEVVLFQKKSGVLLRQIKEVSRPLSFLLTD